MDRILLLEVAQEDALYCRQDAPDKGQRRGARPGMRVFQPINLRQRIVHHGKLGNPLKNIAFAARNVWL